MSDAQLRAETTPVPTEGTSAPDPAAAPGPALAAARPATRRRYDRSIVEGPLGRAVWKLAWPTMLANAVGGMQGLVDHVMVGNTVGYAANAAIGVSWQIMLVVIMFVSSLFAGMGVLVARFAGANDEEKVDRAVYQAFLVAAALSVFVLAPAGYVLAPVLLNLVNAAPAVQAQALPFLRVMFLCSSGMLVSFMLGGALRAAGDARTPMVLGVVTTGLNICLNVVLIGGAGPIPAFGTVGAAMGTSISSGLVAIYGLTKLWKGGWVVSFPRHGFAPDWSIIRALFRFGLPTGIQGVAMNVGGVLLLGFIGSLAQSAAAQAAYAVAYSQLFSFVTWTSVGLMGAAAAVAGQNLGAGHPDRARDGVGIAARIAFVCAALVGACFFFFPGALLGIFGMRQSAAVGLGVELLRILSVSGLFVSVALAYTGGLQGTGDTRAPLYISLVSQVLLPLGICFAIRRAGHLDPVDIWMAILAGHATRCTLSVLRFRQGAWRKITVNIGGRAG